MTATGLLRFAPRRSLSRLSPRSRFGGAPSISACPAEIAVSAILAAMRPGRDDIALPPFPPATSWIGGRARRRRAADRATARCWSTSSRSASSAASGPSRSSPASTIATRERASRCSACTRRAPTWRARDEALAAAPARLELPFPVANDREHRIWHAYGCKGWPSTFLWGRGGNAALGPLRRGRLPRDRGRGPRRARGGDGHDLPEPMLGRAGRARPARARRSRATRSSRAAPTTGRGRPSEPGEPLIVEYAGGGAWAALDGAGTVSVAVDEEPAADLHARRARPLRADRARPPRACTRCGSTSTARSGSGRWRSPRARPRSGRLAIRRRLASASSTRIFFGSMKRTSSSIARSSETSVGAAVAEELDELGDELLGGAGAGRDPDRVDALEPCLLDLAGVVDQVGGGAELAGHVDEPVGVGGVLRADTRTRSHSRASCLTASWRFVVA